MKNRMSEYIIVLRRIDIIVVVRASIFICTRRIVKIRNIFFMFVSSYAHVHTESHVELFYTAYV